MDGNQYMSSMMGDMNEPEAAYPEIALRMQPFVDDAVETFMGGPISESEVGRMTSEAVRNSGVLNDPPRGHNAGTVSDVARTLVLGGLLNRFGPSFYPFPLYPPFFFPPFWGGGFRDGRFRDGRFHDGRFRGRR